MERNKYDLVDDVAEMLIGMEDFNSCGSCIMGEECKKKIESNERTLCFSKEELTETIVKKYGI